MATDQMTLTPVASLAWGDLFCHPDNMFITYRVEGIETLGDGVLVFVKPVTVTDDGILIPRNGQASAFNFGPNATVWFVN